MTKRAIVTNVTNLAACQGSLTKGEQSTGRESERSAREVFNSPIGGIAIKKSTAALTLWDDYR